MGFCVATESHSGRQAIKDVGEKMHRVEIRIAGYFDEEWVEWFNGFTIIHTTDAQTILTGDLPDHAALYGLIAKLRDLGAKLISVNFDSPANRQLD